MQPERTEHAVLLERPRERAGAVRADAVEIEMQIGERRVCCERRGEGARAAVAHPITAQIERGERRVTSGQVVENPVATQKNEEEMSKQK